MNVRSQFSKGLILVMLLTFSLGTTGCTWFGGDDSSYGDTTEQVKRIGVLKSLGGMSVGDATHLLEDEDGLTLRLKSLNIDLSQEKYLNKKVEVRGGIKTAEDGKEVMDVVSIDLSEDEDTDTRIKGEPKEYKNADLGFNLTYYDSWAVEENSDEVVFTSAMVDDISTDSTDLVTSSAVEETNPSIIIVKRLQNPDKEDVETYLQLPSDASNLSALGYTKSVIGKDKLEGLKKENENMLEVNAWLSRDKYIYQFSFVGTENEGMVNDKNAYFSMLASLQFIGFSTDDEETPEESDDDSNSTEDEIVKPEIVNPVIDEPEIEEVITIEEDDTAPITSSSSYGVIAQYIRETMNSIAPEESEGGKWTATTFSFADPNYVYVDYTDGSADRRVLLTYKTDGGLSTKLVGYFTPGETTSWQRVSGENPVESSEKTVVTVTDSGAEETAKIKEGYRYFESLPYDFNAQYPSSWYFNGTGGSGDINHHYGFSNEPVEDGNELVSVDIVSSSMPSGSGISVGGHSGVKVYEGGEVSIYIKRDDGKLYKIHGGTEYEQYVIDIAASITEV